MVVSVDEAGLMWAGDVERWLDSCIVGKVPKICGEDWNIQEVVTNKFADWMQQIVFVVKKIGK